MSGIEAVGLQCRKTKGPGWSCPSSCLRSTAVAQSTTAGAQALAPGCRSNADTDNANTKTDSVITKALATKAHDDTMTAHGDHASITQHDRAPMFATSKPNDPGLATPMPHAKSTETDNPAAPTVTHNATVLDSNKPSTQEQQPDTPSGGSIASVQSQSPSANRSRLRLNDPRSPLRAPALLSSPTQAAALYHHCY